MSQATKPSNVCVVLLDSLNRHMLGSYGGTEFETPNLDRFATERAVRFTNHVTGSLPCMPARHDILCGSLDFLWKPWGSIEMWEAAARTTTSTSTDGSTYAAMRATCGAHTRTRRGPAHQRYPPAEAVGSTRSTSVWTGSNAATTDPARSSEKKPTGRAHAP